MFRPRIIPVLLLKGKGLVKTIQFRNPRYIGDPINAVRIFNDLKADELVFLDILASKEGRTISLEFVKNVGEEASMPFAVGGGIRTSDQIREILHAGAEKVVINTEAALHPDFIRQASETFGSSTIAVCLDVKKKRFGKEQTWILNGSKATGFSPADFGQLMEEKGAGEIIIQSIENDGMMNGYDIGLICKVSEAVTIPVVALGGAGSLADFAAAVQDGYASAVAAGSLFVYHGERRAVLVNYPDQAEINCLFSESGSDK
jgi:imidazole glycerol-phosphate synthase subunit HisF